MEAEAEKEQNRTAKIQAYAEALDFFIENPKAINDPTLRLLRRSLERGNERAQ